MKSTLEALDAALMEWVTISMVCPLALIFENKAKIWYNKLVEQINFKIYVKQI